MRLCRNAWAPLYSGTPISQATPNAPSGGRVESLCKGLSGMDAARAAMGQGWPFAACPWNNDGARGPDEVGPDARGKPSWLLLGRLPEVTRCKSGTGIANTTDAASSRRKKVPAQPPQWRMKRASATRPGSTLCDSGQQTINQRLLILIERLILIELVRGRHQRITLDFPPAIAIHMPKV